MLQDGNESNAHTQTEFNVCGCVEYNSDTNINHTKMLHEICKFIPLK